MLSIAVSPGTWLGYVLVGLMVRKLAGWGMTIWTAKAWALSVSCVLLSLAVVAGLTSYRYVAVGCLVRTGIGMAGFMVIFLTLVQDLDPSHVGVTTGLLGGLGNLVYASLNPYIGILADMGRTSLVFVMIGCLPWLAFLTIMWGCNTKTQ